MFIQNVKLDGHDHVATFLSEVPTRYCAYIRGLEVSFRPGDVIHPSPTQSDFIILLLQRCPMIQRLTLHMFGSPAKSIIPSFTKLLNLSSLHVGNIAPESLMPL